MELSAYIAYCLWLISDDRERVRVVSRLAMQNGTQIVVDPSGQDRLERRQMSQAPTSVPSTSSSVAVAERARCSSRKTVGASKFPDTCLFCMQPGDTRNCRHSYEKLELTNEIKNKAFLMNDVNVLTQLSSGDLVSNEIKYHTNCYINFNRHFKSFQSTGQNTESEVDGIKILEEILGMVEESLAARKKIFHT